MKLSAYLRTVTLATAAAAYTLTGCATPRTPNQHALAEILEKECDAVVINRNENDDRKRKVEKMLACVLGEGDQREAKWIVNLDRLSDVQYRHHWGEKDEVYLVTSEGTAFSLYLPQESAGPLLAYLQGYLQQQVDDNENEIVVTAPPVEEGQ